MSEQCWVTRPWGRWTVVDYVYDPATGKYPWKMKRLVIEPHKELSIQTHKNRRELWIPKIGRFGYRLQWSKNNPMLHEVDGYYEGIASDSSRTMVRVESGTKHQLFNNTDEPVELVEIQSGIDCDESDIERFDSWN